jgi:hypothetical protein
MVKNTVSTTMVPISGRVPEDLYQWLSTQPLDDATTMSDKLRVAVSALKRIHKGDSNYADGLSMYRDLLRNTRDQVAALERDTGEHSEVLATFLEHLPALNATLNAATVPNVEEARQLENQLVKRIMLLCESLLRQGITPDAAAFDAKVIHNNAARVTDLVRVLGLQRH